MAPDNQNELTDSFGRCCDGGRTRWHLLSVRRSVLEPNHVPKCRLPSLALGIRLHRPDSHRQCCAVCAVSRSQDRRTLRQAPPTLRRGLSEARITGRLPVDVDAEIIWRFPGEIPGSSASPASNPVVSRDDSRRTSSYAFSPTCNSASLKGTPQPPIPQYPFGFFARYCW